VDIRSAGEGYTIFEEGTKRVIGQIGTPRVYSECHPGAIYLHKAESYRVKQLDQGKREVWAEAAEVDYYTKALSEKETEILSVVRSRPLFNFKACYGKLKVTERVRGFEKRKIFGQDLLSVHELDMPSHIFETMGLWMVLPEDLSRRVKEAGLHFMGGIHAIEHAGISLFPLFALCDRNDVGGICYPVHPQLERPAIFIYDGYPGGVGLADHGYEILEELLRKTRDLIRECPCSDGCPSCIHSPKCGSGNKPLDKGAAVALLGYLLGEADLETRKGEKGKGKNISTREEVVPPPDSGWSEPEVVAKTAPPEWLKEEISRSRVLFLDIETQRSAEEVGGWQNKHLMRVATAVIYDSREDSFTSFGEDRVHELFDRLKAADLIVGFNIVDFDYHVLKGYSSFRFQDLKTFDLLQEVSKQLGYRLSLNHLAHKTLNREKSADGLQSLQWFKEGKMEEVIAYCEKDVEITKDLFLFGVANGYLLFETRSGQLVRLPVAWKLSELLARKN